MSAKIKDCWYKEVCTNQCSNSCIRYNAMKSLLSYSNLPPSKHIPVQLIPMEVDLNSFCKLAEIKNNIKDFVQSGSNLYIYSSVTGNGKTSWSIKLLLKYFDEIWAGSSDTCKGLFINVPNLLSDLKQNISNNSESFNLLRDNITRADLVIWDDIASTQLSEYDHSQLFSFIDKRMLENKSNIFTGNLTSESQLSKNIGKRLTSRIWNSSTLIQLRGSDRRNGSNSNIE